MQRYVYLRSRQFNAVLARIFGFYVRLALFSDRFVRDVIGSMFPADGFVRVIDVRVVFVCEVDEEVLDAGRHVVVTFFIVNDPVIVFFRYGVDRYMVYVAVRDVDRTVFAVLISAGGCAIVISRVYVLRFRRVG